MTDLTAFDPIQAGLAELGDKYSWTPEQLDNMLTLIDGDKEVKAAKKDLTSRRTAVGRAHKEAKAPLLEATRAIDGKKKEIEAAIKAIEAPIDAAIQRKKDNDAKAASEAKDARIAELEAQLNASNKALEDAGVTESNFTPGSLNITISSRAQITALGKVFGAEAVKGLKHDEDGTPYVLKCTLERSEIQEVE